MINFKTTAISLGAILISVLLFTGIANAQSFKAGDSIRVEKSQTIDSMLMAGGKTIEIAGVVNGDVYCAGQSITISGQINGDVFCAGQTITVSGPISGSVRLAGQSITINSTIGGSASIGAQDLVLSSQAIIGRDLLGGSENVTIAGKIGRDSVIGSSSLIIDGQIGRNLKGQLESITVGPTGEIGGNVDYIGTSNPTVNTGGKITGSVNRTEPEKKQQNDYTAALNIGSFFFTLLPMLIVGLVLIALFPRIFVDSSEQTIKKPGRAVLVGFLSLIVTPIAIVMAFVSIIGIPLAVMTLLIWILVMLSTGPFVGHLIGKLIMRSNYQAGWAMLFGVTILAILLYVPFVGGLVWIGMMILGSGMILIQTKKLMKRKSLKTA
ncbi:hypothetical protein HGB24_03045 [Candidatus Saccharibacteria bacterium]|nr:hypothetical protein [Candidatus Saccharibacteria bacterium]